MAASYSCDRPNTEDEPAADIHVDKPIVYTAMNAGGCEEEQFAKWLLALEHTDLIDMTKPLGKEIVRDQRQVTRLQEDYDTGYSPALLCFPNWSFTGNSRFEISQTIPVGG